VQRRDRVGSRRRSALKAGYPKAFGNYVLLEKLATGGMSQLDLARYAVAEASFVRFVVIKRLKTDKVDDGAFVRMFMDEARITAELHHANIAQVFDFGKVGDTYFMALEYIPGVDVRTIVKALGDSGHRVPIRVTLRILCDVLDGLGYAHGRIDTYGRPMNIVHRDVNPRNIMVSIRGEVKVIDFGVAKAADRLERTAAHVVKGKVAYMAPEQVEGRPLDHRADLFAVGLTLYELIAGFSPFHGLGQIQVMNRLLNQPLPDPAVPANVKGAARLLEVYRKSVERDPEHRYQLAEEMRDRLLEVAAENGGLASREEVAHFLVQRVDQELDTRLSGKVSRWSGPIDVLDDTLSGQDAGRTGTSTGSVALPDRTTEATGLGPNAESDSALVRSLGSVSAAPTRPPEGERSASRSVAAQGVVAGGIAVILMLGVAVVALVVAIGVALYLQGGGVVSEAPPVASSAAAVAPAPARARDTGSAAPAAAPVAPPERAAAPAKAPAAPAPAVEAPPAQPEAAPDTEPPQPPATEPGWAPGTAPSDLKGWD
jgi:serine/threonine-protein kinase